MSKAIKPPAAQKTLRGETAKQVAEIVRYLFEKQERDEMLCASFHDKAGLDIELESIASDLERANKRLEALYSHFQMGRLEPFTQIQERVSASREAAMTAWVQARCARQELAIEHPQRTRVLNLQRSAVRLAVAYFDHIGRGQARAHAKVIMQKTGLPEPEESTVTKWIKEFRGQ
ncbi:MAG: hypothetical protein I8H67_09495 [Comamonadaceae bacterium]|jgi:hypothetical protein|nr:hypothetical protein [Comamonadaceae bacterium]MBH2044027.1 hypothetical protein [Comamonadaceae bacterium]